MSKIFFVCSDLFSRTTQKIGLQSRVIPTSSHNQLPSAHLWNPSSSQVKLNLTISTLIQQSLNHLGSIPVLFH
jgi:hypothetical protein